MADHNGPVVYRHDEADGPIEPGTFGFSRRIFLTGAGSVAAAALLAACGGSNGGSTAGDGSTTTGGTVTTERFEGAVATTAEGSTTTAATRTEAQTETITIGVPSLQEAHVDPHFAVGGLIFPLRDAIAEFLYYPDQSGQYVPTLATGFELSEDRLTWTFTLREGVKMHDGSTFTANDVKTAIDRIVQGEDFTHLTTFKSFVTGAEVIDDQTVAIITNAPYATLVVDLPPPIATDYYNTVGDAEFRLKPVAAGPWKFVAQELNANVQYERFDDYFDPARKPNWRKLVYAIVPDESSRVAGVRTGTLDIAYGLTGATADGMGDDPNVRIEQIPDTGLGYCMMYDNVFPDIDSPLKDQRVRRALLLAVDRDSIAETLYRGYARTATSNAPIVMPGFDPNRTAEPYDPEEATRLLTEAGYPDGFDITLNSYAQTSTLPDVQKLAETVAAFWSQVGVNATLNIADSATILPEWRNKALAGAGMIAGPTSFYVEPSRLALSFFSSAASYSTVVDDATLEDIVARINAETDATARQQLGRELADYLDEQLYGLPLVVVSSLVAVGPNVAEFAQIRANPYAGPTSYIVAT
ncbi:MAG: ABC transporter substrate-binding protein [Acidimicrobiales bacterium]